MLITETAPQQAEHFEWLNAIDFYNSYLEIIKDRIEALNGLDQSVQLEQKKNQFEEKLELLKERLNELSLDVSVHIEEIETEPIFENRLNITLQSAHHMGLRENFEIFELDLNDFRAAFNEFYVRCI
jgi:predicted nuclease with TOPRIM domain